MEAPSTSSKTANSNLNGPLQRGFNTRSAARYIDFSEGFLRKARRGKTKVPGPNYRRIGNRVIYLREELDAFLDQFPNASRPGVSE